MITRLEADGFKNLLDFEVDFGPYTCIAGPNAVGKSNVFDAIEFLSLLADVPFMEAAQRLRSAGERSIDASSLFWHDEEARPSDMRLAAEMLVAPEVEDEFGRTAQPTTTFLRYELVLRYEAPNTSAGSRFGRIVLVKESLTHIKKGDAKQHMAWPHKATFRDSVVLGRRSGAAYISTRVDDDGVSIVEVHQDAGSRGKPRPTPAERAPRTIVATTTTISDPTILAARREMMSWRKLALEPSSMRAPDSLDGPTEMAADGSHLAAALYRLGGERPDDVYARVAGEASALVDIRAVDVEVDLQRNALTLKAQVGRGPMLPARALSDGTLRFLALCILKEDPNFDGLICMEEPENGIHPAKMSAMVELVKSLAVDPFYPSAADNPLRQVVINTHSPYLVVLQEDEDLLVAVQAMVRRGNTLANTIRLLPLIGSWRTSKEGYEGSRASIVDYLRWPADAPQRQQLDWLEREPELH